MDGFQVLAYNMAPSREVTSPPEPSGPILDLLPFGMYVCDREGLIVSCNRRAVELWGRTPKLSDFSERFSGAFRLYRLDGGPLDNCACPVAEVLSTGEPVRGQELVIERPDGSQIVARVDINAITDERGGIVGAVTCFRDITAERRSQSRPREIGRQSQEILEALPAAVYMTDAEGRIIFYNKAAAELWGCHPELGKSAFCGSWKLLLRDGTPPGA